MSIPFVAFGNDELAKLPALGDEVFCPQCGKMHKTIYGKRILEDGTEIEDRTIAGYKCKGELYLAGVEGKDVTGLFKKEIGRMKKGNG